MSRSKMLPKLNHGHTPRYTPPFVVRELCSCRLSRRYSVKSFAEAVRFAKHSVACGYDATVVDAGNNLLWHASPDAVRNRKKRKGGA